MVILELIFFGVLGALFGSFSGALAERLNTGGKFLSARSKCNSCGRTLGVPDLVPVLSWIASLGRCRSCKVKVPVRYLLIELALAILFMHAYLAIGISFELGLFCAALVVLTVLTLYDLAHTIVPESLAAALFVLSFLFALVRTPSMHALSVTVITAGCIGLFFFLMHVLSRGRAMGLGDAPVAASLSLLAGSSAFAGFLFSFWIGGLVGIGILVGRRKGHRMGIEVPFVPFLAVGFLLAFFSGWNPLPW
ncbi:MAG: leader peptidase (prepilin peptidase) / N-methyltransferase [Parcubacteria bacterium C7867-001]|nr:MAG: leader peptidase (prepilin peptidase) / N-methyltransferase [Parcubacteria bacterium C7867-001]